MYKREAGKNRRSKAAALMLLCLSLVAILPAAAFHFRLQNKQAPALPFLSSSSFHYRDHQRRSFSSSAWSLDSSSASIDNEMPATTTATSPTSKTLLPPAAVSKRLFRDPSSSSSRPIILFDGVCNLCNGAVNLALDWDPNGKFRFAALQSEVGRALLQQHGRNANDISSIVVVTENGAYTKSDAILEIAQELSPLPLMFSPAPAVQLARLVVPKFLRDLIYDGVADNRYQIMGMRDTCRLEDDTGNGQFADRFVDDALAYEE